MMQGIAILYLFMMTVQAGAACNEDLWICSTNAAGLSLRAASIKELF